MKKRKGKPFFLFCIFKERERKINCRTTPPLPGFAVQFPTFAREIKEQRKAVSMIYCLCKKKERKQKSELLPPLGLPRRRLDLLDVLLQKRRHAPPGHPASRTEPVADGLRHGVLTEGTPGSRGRRDGDHSVFLKVLVLRKVVSFFLVPARGRKKQTSLSPSAPRRLQRPRVRRHNGTPRPSSPQSSCRRRQPRGRQPRGHIPPRGGE